MRRLVFNSDQSVTFLFRDGSGNPLSGLVFSDLVLYLVKEGGTPTLFTITSGDFEELDATNVPGLYRIDFSASEVDTEGSLSFYSQANGGVSLAAYYEEFRVEVVEDPVIEVYGSILPQNTTQTLTVYISEQGSPLTGLSSSLVTALLFKAGTQSSSTVSTTWTELNSGTLPGWYSFTLSTSDLDTLGDLVIDFTTGGSSQGFVDQTSNLPAAFLGSTNRGNTVFVKDSNVLYVTSVATVDGFTAIDPVQSLNGGDTYASLDIGIDRAYSTGGVRGTNFVAFGLEDSGSPNFYYSDDNAATFNTATEGTFSVFEAIVDISMATTDLGWMVATTAILKWDRNVSAGTLPVDLPRGGIGLGSEIFQAVHALSSSTVVTVGNEGVNPIVGRTTDGGSNWNAVTTGDSNVIYYDVSFAPSSTTGWIVGQGGRILKSTDSGASFTGQTSPTSQDLRGVLALSDQEAWAVGVGVVLQTTNGGTTWTDVRSSLGIPATYDGYAIDGTLTTPLWVAGEDDSPEVIVYQITSVSSPAKRLRFRYVVVEPSSVDLTPVTTSLDEIKGTGFDTNTDALVHIKDDFTTSFSSVQGTGFDSSTDSLVQIRDNLGGGGGGSTDLTPVLSAISNLDSDVVDLRSEVDGITILVQRVLGLSQENYRITNQVYDGNNKLTQATITTYPSKIAAESASSPLAVYALTAQYDAQGLLVDYLVTKEV